MNLYVTISATRVLRILVVCWTSRLIRTDAMVHAMTRQAKVIDRTELQHPWIRGAMRDVTGDAPVRLDRRVFERKWTLLVGVTLQTRCISTNRQPRLF